MPAKTKTAPAPKSKKAEAPRMSLAEVMAFLKKSGSEQTRKTYARHGVTEAMFGVSFATLKGLYKKIKLDHELALALWDTGNFDAKNLAVKIVDPQRMSPAELDRWAGAPGAPMCSGYVAAVTQEGPHGRGRADAWLASKDEGLRAAGWQLASAMAMRDTATPDAWFAERLAAIEKGIHGAPNDERHAMNQAVISIGCRSAALKKAALSAAKKIGKVEIDYGDTSCKTPDAAGYIEKCWAHAAAKKYESPAAQERDRESMRTRC